MSAENTAVSKRTAGKNRSGRFLSKDLFSGGKMDLTFLFLVLGILATGLVMLFSASAPYASTYYGDSYHFIKRQAVFAVGGVIVMLAVSKLNYHKFKAFAWPLFVVSIIMLVMVLFLPEVVPGFKRWLGIGSFSFQPSEVAKFAVILLFAALISNKYSQMRSLKLDFTLLGFVALVCGLIILEHHLSATILVLLIGIAMSYVGGMNKKLAVFIAVAGVIGAILLVLLSIEFPEKFNYISDRMNIWLHLWDYDRDLTHQTRQSLLAIGSGGLTGQGIGQSTQKYLWVPEPQNDFIFSIVCEELGLFGALLIVVAFALLCWRGLVIATRANDKFGSLLVFGITFQIGLQTVLNLLVVTNSMPNTGISLPFFSYGGSSLLMLLAQMGVVLSVSRQANIEKG